MARKRSKANEEAAQGTATTEPTEPTSTAVAERPTDAPDEQVVLRNAEQAQRDAEHRVETAHTTEQNGHHAHGHRVPYIANPSMTRRPVQSHAEAVTKRQSNLPSKLSVSAGDMKVQMIDKGDNAAGIGIRVVFPDGAENRPTEEEKAIIRRHVKGEEGENTGFNWNGSVGMWHKHIVRHGEHPEDVPGTRAVAIRLDAENRVEKLAEALRQHSADPVGFAESVRQRREQAVQGHGIPD
ncbi:MAG: hypothetical protein K8U57_27360 [Planctomycetes bacterium]|nr:hypothetical protein [Planctomycetota bacterium]